MKISYNWIKKYLDIDLPAEELAEILTDTGLEVDGFEEVYPVKGGLKNVVIGEILACEKHENADRLNVTKVDVGGVTNQIVCGAPNVAKGQKVIVALPGAELYPTGNEEGFTIKKAKIRGVESIGMICAEDELGIGASHDGIMVLQDAPSNGSSAAKYLDLEPDIQFEIGLTPNRCDAMSHLGVARDIRAYMNFHKGVNLQIKTPEVQNIEKGASPVNLELEWKEACPYYSGVLLENVEVKDSPECIQKRLKSIGLKPINNVVDITNFVLHECGQPLHAFDADVVGETIVVRQTTKGEKFTTLDELELELSGSETMIANTKEGMCLAGVYGGVKSGTTEKTTRVYLESAFFNPAHARKTAKSNGLHTDASFRFERGVDPAMVSYALNRAVALLQEFAGAKVVGGIGEAGHLPALYRTVEFNPSKSNELLGLEISEQEQEQILNLLDISVKDKDGDKWTCEVPAYRWDVTRAADISEEIIRIYGINRIQIPEKLNTSIVFDKGVDRHAWQNKISEMLVGAGFSEIMNNSLSKPKYAEWSEMKERAVTMLNPLSSELSTMRVNSIFPILESIAYNKNRRAESLRFFEFGNSYSFYENEEGKVYQQQAFLAIALFGKKGAENWSEEHKNFSYFDLKSVVLNLLNRLGLNKNIRWSGIENDPVFEDGEKLAIAKKKDVVKLGWIKANFMDKMGIDEPTLIAEINWDAKLELQNMNRVKFKELPKFPEVKRDLSLLLDKEVSFSDLKQEAEKAEKKLLKSVGLFDVYEGKNLEKGKKSYALRFVLADESKTLSDKEIDKSMERIQKSLLEKFDASLR
jgi:phenylalanyl-tRNA synthetase beta chain